MRVFHTLTETVGIILVIFFSSVHFALSSFRLSRFPLSLIGRARVMLFGFSVNLPAPRAFVFQRSDSSSTTPS